MPKKSAFDRKAWLEERRKGIGGSDAAAVLGKSPYMSPIHLFQDKTGRTQIDDEMAERLEWGIILEGPISERYASMTGRKVERNEKNKIFQSKKHPFMICTPDGTTWDKKFKGPGNFQIKTAHPMNRHQWLEETPLHYQVQVQHEMYVRKMKWASIPVLFGNEKLEHIDIELNDEFVSLLIEAEEEFWDYVQKDELPPIQEHWNQGLVNDALKQLNPEETTDRIVLEEDDYVRFAKNVLEANEEIRKWEGVHDLYENKLIYAMRDARSALLMDGRVLKLSRTAVAEKEISFTRKGYVMTRLTIPKSAKGEG